MSLYENIAKKRARIKAGSKEKMRAPGAKGAPTAAAFKKAAKTAKKPAKKKAKK
jgi:cysteine sulfinate desulfinase/cysteine desulfurase-like protein